MAELNLNGSSLGNVLTQVLLCEGLLPGDTVSYQTCKAIYEFHPLGAKLVEAPIAMAMGQPREIAVSRGPEERVKKAFEEEWVKVGADTHITNLMRLSRIYGIASVAMLVKGEASDTEVDFSKLWEREISFSVFDPLNTSGSLVQNLEPNAMDFLKNNGSIVVQNTRYHRSRVVIRMNEQPIYLGYTTSAFGYVGRSVYQRTLYPLKSFLQTMRTDDLVTRKAGIIVAKMKGQGSVVNGIMQAMTAVKRSVLKVAETDNILSIDTEEEITAIDLTNVNAAMSESRKNILNNIAAGAGMPAILVNEETFAEGFGEGTEDAKHVALFIDGFRREMQGAYEFFDKVVQHRAWNEEFFKGVQKDFPEEYGGKSYNEAFFQWQNSFEAVWPSLLTEPDSEKSKSDKVKLDALQGMLAVLLPIADPVNKANILSWAQDNINAMEMLFTSPLLIDAEAMAEYEPPPPPGMEEGEGDAKADSVVRRLASVGR